MLNQHYINDIWYGWVYIDHIYLISPDLGLWISCHL